MRKKILYLESPALGESYKWMMEQRFGINVVLTKDIRLAEKLIESNDCGLVIAEPMEFGLVGRESVVIPILKRLKRNR